MEPSPDLNLRSVLAIIILLFVPCAMTHIPPLHTFLDDDLICHYTNGK